MAVEFLPSRQNLLYGTLGKSSRVQILAEAKDK